MIRFWLFIRVALLKIKNARLRAENKILRDQLLKTIHERDFYVSLAITGKRPRSKLDSDAVNEFAEAIRKAICR